VVDRKDGADPAGRKGPLGPAPPDATSKSGLRWRGLLLGLGLIGLLACVLVLALLAEVVQARERDALDAFASPFFHGLASPPLDALMNAATFLGYDTTLVPIALVLGAALAWAGRRREALFLAVVLGGSLLVDSAMKLFFHRPRPALPWAHVLPDYSFPSGHSMNSLALGLALSLIAWRLFGPRVGALAVGLAILVSLTIGVSRIYLGYHYATDVIGGFASAILWVAFVVGVFRASRSGESLRAAMSGLRRASR
jgi:undecaprenyl-diphosphatase